MTEKFGRLALHMWTIDTTPLADRARCGQTRRVRRRRIASHRFQALLRRRHVNAQVLDLIKKAGIPVGVLGVEYGWLFATGDESKRLFKVFRESAKMLWRSVATR